MLPLKRHNLERAITRPRRMTRDSKINEEIQKHLYTDEIDDHSVDFLSETAYKALTEEERKIFALKIYDDLEGYLFDEVEGEDIFHDFIYDNKDLLKNLTRDDKLFIASQSNCPDLIGDNSEVPEEVEKIFIKHNIDRKSISSIDIDSLPDNFLLDCLDYIFFTSDGNRWIQYLAYFTCGCLFKSPLKDCTKGVDYALHIMDSGYAIIY